MKKSRILRSAAAVLVSAITVFCSLPRPAYAATTSEIKDQITAITELFLGAGLLALGAILTFSGANIPLGLALMAIGALAIYDAVTENWGGIAELLQGQIGKITAIVSAALLALGAILLFSGANVPLCCFF